MLKLIASTAICLASISAASAEDMNLSQMQKANGLIEIMKRAEPCGYGIDDAALEAYYVENKLSTAEVLSFISAGVSLAELDNAPTKADCTLARTTARSIGILSK